MNRFVKSMFSCICVCAIFVFHLACRLARQRRAISLRVCSHLRFRTAPALWQLICRTYAFTAPIVARLIRNWRAGIAALYSRLRRPIFTAWTQPRES